LKGGVAFVFDGTAMTKAALSLTERGSAQVTALKTHIKAEVNTQSLKTTDSKGLLSVGYPTMARITISIRGHPRAVE
jgi:hypothetical protein